MAVRMLERKRHDQTPVDYLKSAEWLKVSSQGETAGSEIDRFHLMFHLAPAAGNVWRANVRQLKQRDQVFNGKRIVTITTGVDLDDPAEVIAEFGDFRAEFLCVPNSKELRERVNFEAMMSRVASTEPNEATFFAHAKGGFTVGNDEGVMYWRNGMYHHLLDQMPVIRRLLGQFPFVGTHRIVRDGKFPDASLGVPWHFAGTFWWFRNRDVFRPGWETRIPDGGWGIEKYPGTLFPDPKSCACVWKDRPGNSYDPASYTLRIRDELPSRSGSVKVEIGGGRTPRRDGYINVDKLTDPLVDIQFDFDGLVSGRRLPFADDSVQTVYSSHCLEHLKSDTLKAVLWEIVRIVPIGGVVELVLPHWNYNAAMIDTHLRTIGEDQVEHWSETAIPYWWAGSKKRLLHHATNYTPSVHLEEVRHLFAPLGMTDEQLMRYIPDACSQLSYHFTVVGNT